ncbi:MAG: HD domain-containing protein [Halobacteriovoraceae bacterium]|nr:HD domain-containing protein [Halobacteriovoraceae bacterium]
MEVTNKAKVVFDPIYGFIKLTPVEWEIIQSPYYQRLRWIKQLGFSFYVFPGAEHSRFGHSIGVLHNAHCIIKSCGRGVSDKELFDTQCHSKEANYHKSLRLGALMHDLGTFCFSHTTESAYTQFAETTRKEKDGLRKDDHENLGSFIIKNTKQDTGITTILEKNGIDPQVISDLVKGVDPSILANQILHSEIDCDRMDYLLRDAHYTGLKYGSYDRDYLLHHFRTKRIDNHDILTIKEQAIHCVADFLVSRFAWYSQVIRSPRGAKFDALAEALALFFLERGMMYKYSDLLDMAQNDAGRFHGFNDSYFMGLLHKSYFSGELDRYPKYKNMAYCLLFERGPNVIRLDEFSPRLLSQNNESEYDKIHGKAISKAREITEIVEKKGSKEDWVIADLPKKSVIFVNSHSKIVKNKVRPNILLERDPVKISSENGEVKLLVDVDNSIISQLQNTIHYLPNVFCSDGAYEILKTENIVQ